jgi:long-chain acyl-CoA synthetase
MAELVFTSGTTGNPKGVILSHGNIVANARMAATAAPPTPQHRVLSILPLSHMFEQTAGLNTPLSGGASLTYVGSLRPDVIFEAMSQNHITNMGCVPQVLQLFRDGIEREARKQGREQQFARAHRVARYLPLPLRRVLFRGVLQRMGGAFEFFVTGGAFLDPELAGWWEMLGVKVLQGYGMTEASPIVSTDTLRERHPGTVGRPLPGVEVRIADDGEILVRGANITTGYWRNDHATAEAFEDDWYKTGDLGELDERHCLRLRGRKKNLIVLANGMNVYPEDVERALLSDRRVKDAVVIGAARGQDVDVHAVLVLAKDVAAAEAAPIVRAANSHLAPHQAIRGHTLWPDDTFPLTPTLKPKRAEILARLPELQAAHTPAPVAT